MGEKSTEDQGRDPQGGWPTRPDAQARPRRPGRVAVNWNGRRPTATSSRRASTPFRFVGTDVHGVVGKSNDKAVYVSDKQLVKKRRRPRPSAVAASRQRVGRLFGPVPPRLSTRRASTGLRASATTRTSTARVADADDRSAGAPLRSACTTGHPLRAVPRSQAYGAGAFKHAGPGAMLYVRAKRRTSVRKASWEPRQGGTAVKRSRPRQVRSREASCAGLSERRTATGTTSKSSGSATRTSCCS